MPILFARVLTIAAVPFLTLFGFAFLCVRIILAASVRLVGWELAWPPVLVDSDDDQPSILPAISAGPSMPPLPGTAMSRVDITRL